MKIEDFGQIVVTKGVADLRDSNKKFAAFARSCLSRYLSNDWGELSKEDKKTNDRAVKFGDERILAVYKFPLNATWTAVNSWGLKESKLWIITERDHSVTTILFPGEY